MLDPKRLPGFRDGKSVQRVSSSAVSGRRRPGWSCGSPAVEEGGEALRKIGTKDHNRGGGEGGWEPETFSGLSWSV